MKAKEYMENKIFSEIDFSNIEKEIGFSLHDDLKKFYRTVGNDCVYGNMFFQQLPKAENWCDWFESEEQPFIKISLSGTKGYIVPDLFNADGTPFPIDEEAKADRKRAWENYNFEAELLNSFYCFSNRENNLIGFDSKMLLGNLEDNKNRDGLNVLFDNSTGYVEWIDFEWGNFEDYEKNPHGILAYSIDKLIGNMAKN